MAPYIVEKYILHTQAGSHDGSSWANAGGGAGTDAQAGVALKACVEAQTGGTIVYVGPGTFALGTAVIAIPAGVTVIGCGMRVTTITSTNGGTTATVNLVALGSSAVLRAVTVQGLLIAQGQYQAPVGPSDGALGALVESVEILGNSDGIYIGTWISQRSSICFVGCRVVTNFDIAVNFGTCDALLKDCHLESVYVDGITQTLGGIRVAAYEGTTPTLLMQGGRIVHGVGGDTYYFVRAEDGPITVDGVTIGMGFAYPWTVDGDWPKNYPCLYNGVLYKALLPAGQTANVGHQPDIGPTWWHAVTITHMLQSGCGVLTAINTFYDASKVQGVVWSDPVASAIKAKTDTLPAHPAGTRGGLKVETAWGLE